MTNLQVSYIKLAKPWYQYKKAIFSGIVISLRIEPDFAKVSELYAVRFLQSPFADIDVLKKSAKFKRDPE